MYRTLVWLIVVLGSSSLVAQPQTRTTPPDDKRPPWPPEYEEVSVTATTASDQEELVITDANKYNAVSGTQRTRRGYSTAIYVPPEWREQGRRGLQSSNRVRIKESKAQGRIDEMLLDEQWMSEGLALNDRTEMLVGLSGPDKDEIVGLGIWRPVGNLGYRKNAEGLRRQRVDYEKPDMEEQQQQFFELLFQAQVSKTLDRQVTGLDGAAISNDRLIAANAKTSGRDVPIAAKAIPARKGYEVAHIPIIPNTRSGYAFTGGRIVDAHGMRVAGRVRITHERTDEIRSVGFTASLKTDGNGLVVQGQTMHDRFLHISAITANGVAGIALRGKRRNGNRWVAAKLGGSMHWIAPLDGRNDPPHVDMNRHNVVVTTVRHPSEDRVTPMAWHPRKPNGIDLWRYTRMLHDDWKHPEGRASMTVFIDDENRIYIRRDPDTKGGHQGYQALAMAVPEWVREWDDMTQRKKRKGDKEARERRERMREKRRRMRDMYEQQR